ncbi:MAG: aldo/keto reductase [Candidatus Nitrosocaldus sp.]|nr:aldo/keto reductase [Candidatus Nitrosocaldus sp.]MDW8276229.1 aldo/keto reductase [Candidatus Nitrosocaldus sp.]
MRYRRLGKSNIPVSEIGFGAWSIALDWWGKKMDDDYAVKMLKRAYDLGINFFDTADIYGKGRSERLIARAFKDMRDEVVISTKFGYDIYSSVEQIGHGELPQRFDAKYVRYALERSLERLESNYVDVYNLHNPKMYAVMHDPLFLALEQLRSEGRIRHYGVALGPAIGWRDEGVYAMEKRKITALQTVYNILEQEPARQFFPYARARDVGVLVRVPDASGVLTGKLTVNTNLDKNDHRSFRKRAWVEEASKRLEVLKPMADARGWSMQELAIKFILSEQSVSSVLPTITSIEELDAYVSISDGKYLSSDELRIMNEMYDKDFIMLQSIQ